MCNSTDAIASKYIYRVIIFSGGFDGSTSINTILQYNSSEDEFTEVVDSMMLQERRGHAISVVNYSDFSMWCQ